MRVTTTQPAWGGSPTVMLPATGQKHRVKTQQTVCKNVRAPRYQLKPLTEDEKWVLEALYKRLPTF